jgi:hypothetical protein
MGAMMNQGNHLIEMTHMATRKADVAELIAVRCGLEAERATDSARQGELIAGGPVWPRVIELTHDSDANLRRWAVEVLRLGSPARYRREVLGKLMKLAEEDSDGRVRKSAQKALESYRDEAQLSFFKPSRETVDS